MLLTNGNLNDLPVWIAMFSHLPDGIHEVTIEGIRGNTEHGGIHLDDIDISDCAEFSK